MKGNRSNLGFGGELEDFDPNIWAASKSKPRPSPEPTAARQIAEAAGFKSREPSSPPPEGRPDRRRRTGRNAQFNLKAKPETIEAFCQIADRQGWGLGETLEKAVAMLQERFGVR